MPNSFICLRLVLMELYPVGGCVLLSMYGIHLNSARTKAPKPFLQSIERKDVQLPVQNEELRKAEIDAACVTPN